MDQTIKFHQHTFAYLVEEENGLVTGSYRIDGYAQISHQTFANRKYVKWYLTIGVSGSTVANLNGEAEWYGSAHLSVGDEITKTQSLEDHNINSEELNNPESSYVGSATFSIPITSQSVQAILNVGYRLSNEQCHGGYPVPESITEYINILHL